MSRFKKILALAALTMVAALPVAAATGGRVVTDGRFSEFAAGPDLGYDDITGRTRMVRNPRGRTIVAIRVYGLQPNTTYGSHVHAAACAVGDANGHYKFDPLGPATPPNEIWPGPFTTDFRGRGIARTVVDAIAGPDAVSVVIHAPDGSKIACADLS